MLTTLIAQLVAFSGLIPTALVLVFWWCARRAGYPVGVLPWLVAYVLLTRLIMPHLVFITPDMLREATDRVAASGVSIERIGPLWGWVNLCLTALGFLREILLYLLVLGNVAEGFSRGGEESRVWRFFRGCYERRVALGVVLLVSVPLPQLTFWVALRYTDGL